jgi:hypothetical protein
MTRKTPHPVQIHVYDAALMPGYNPAMNGLTIYLDWQYFLGILGALIGMAYYANGRFTKIETTVEWLRQTLLEIKARLEDGTAQQWTDVESRQRSPRRSSKRESRP